eukprot:UN09573
MFKFSTKPPRVGLLTPYFLIEWKNLSSYLIFLQITYLFKATREVIMERRVVDISGSSI